MKTEEIIHWILKHPQAYPGPHNQLQPKIFKNILYKKQINNIHQQFSIILKQFNNFLFNHFVNEDSSLHCSQLGVFLIYKRTIKVKDQFENCTKLLRNSYDKQNKNFRNSNIKRRSSLNKQQQKIYNPQIFVKFDPLSYLSKSIHSIYYDEKIQKNYQNFVYKKLNKSKWTDYSEIASNLLFPKQLIAHHLKIFNKAISDLTDLNKSLQLDLGIIRFIIQNKKLCQLNNTIKLKEIQRQKVNAAKQQLKKNNRLKQNIDIWSDKYQKMWNKSLMAGLANRTNMKQIKNHYQKGFKLKVKQMLLK